MSSGDSEINNPRIYFFQLQTQAEKAAIADKRQRWKWSGIIFRRLNANVMTCAETCGYEIVDE